MDLMEYKAKELFAKFGIPVMKGITVEEAGSLNSMAVSEAGLRFPLVVKAQVQTGGRGKAGGIKFAGNAVELYEAAKSTLGMDIKGHIVKKLLVTEKVEVNREWYLSIMLDRLTKGPVTIFSPLGGIDIEETAKKTPDKVLKLPVDPMLGIKEYHARYLAGKSGIDAKYEGQLLGVLKNLYGLFCEYNCMLTEINPLAVTADGRLVAIDGKVSIDDSALPALPDMMAFRDSLDEDALVLEARKNRFLYIPCDPEGDIAVMSNGSGMIMSCMDLISKQGMKVGAALDLGGGATSDRIAEAVRTVLSNKSIKALMISIFGGITRCDEVAGGLRFAMESGKAGDAFVVVRVEGTNKEKGLEIIKGIKGNVTPVDNIAEGVRELAAGRCGI